MYKNAGLFFNDELKAANYGGGYGYGSSASEVACMFDALWVMGEYPYPGGCNPNYSIQFALDGIQGMYPQINAASPILLGFPWLPFAGTYDDELMRNDFHRVIR